MTESRRVTELNQKSLSLTDAELALVDKFSVLLPMSELPEVVVANHATEPSKENSESDIPEDAIIPFNPSPSKTSAPKNEQPVLEETPPPTQSQISSEQPVDNQSENESDEDSFEDAVTVEFPRDELSITQESTEDSPDDANERLHAGEAEEAVFDIAANGNCHDRVVSVAESIELKLADAQPGLLGLVSPGKPKDQDLVFNSLMVALANRNPDWRMIAVQGVEPMNQDSQFSIGLGHVLSDEHLLEDVVIPTTIENMDYLAYTEFSLTNTAFKNRIGRMLDELKKHYDVVFYNAKTASSQETGVLAELIDSIYLLVNTSSEQAPVVSAVEGLRKKGARLSGCILSDYQREAS